MSWPVLAKRGATSNYFANSQSGTQSLLPRRRVSKISSFYQLISVANIFLRWFDGDLFTPGPNASWKGNSNRQA
jgi:hypothetical protein